MIKGHEQAWNDSSENRIASTLDIGATLALAEPGSYDEFLLCYEAAHDTQRPLEDRSRFLLASYGRQFVDAPDSLSTEYDEIEDRIANGVGDYILIKRNPSILFLGRVASPEVRYNARIAKAAGVPMGIVDIDVAAVINTVLDENDKLVPELSRDFVEWRSRPFVIETIGTDIVWDDDTNKFVRCEHNSVKEEISVGFNEINTWLQANPHWTEHYDNMLRSYTTRGVNIPVAQQQPFENSLHLLDN